MSNHPMQALGVSGGGGGSTAAQMAQRDHLDCVELGRIEMYTGRRTITPEYARVVLERYAPEDSNRKLRRFDVKQYAADIREGRWRSETHQGIAFDVDGNLSDGQHRLHACIEAGIPITLPVTYGQPRDVFAVVDQGVPRKALDLITVARIGVTNPHDAATVGRTVLLMRRHRDGFSTGGLGGMSVSRRVVLDFVTQNVDAINAACKIGARVWPGMKGGASKSQIGTAAFLIREACKDDTSVNAFFEQLQHGANLGARSPVLLLRDGLPRGAFLTNNPAGDVRIAQVVCAILSTWNLWRAKRATTVERSIRWVAGEPFPVPRS